MSRTSLLTGVLLSMALLAGGCAGADADRHGAGEKVAGEADTGERGEADAEAGRTADTERLPDVRLDWLRPPADGVRPDSGEPDSGGRDGDEATDDEPVRLDALAGEPLVINVWATWCPPCRDEMPYFQQLHERADGKLRVIGVDYSDDADSASALLDELGVRYPQLFDPDAELKVPFGLGVGIPATVYVRADGEIAHIARTPYQNLDQLRADVESYLDVSR